VPRWELMCEVVKNLGTDWQVGASGPQDLGHFAGLASGPGGIRLYFIARTEKLDPCMEHSCPPLGWLRVYGRFNFADEWLESKLSITLQQSLGAEGIANELIVRFLPLYADVVAAVQKHNSQHPETELDNRQSFR
jgi:hypothetical protein